MSLLVGKLTAQVIARGFPRVLVAPKDFIITGTSLLLAVNDSANSQQAAREALSLGRTCTTLQRLTVLAVAKDEEVRASADRLVEEVLNQAQREGVVIPCEGLVRVGEPAACIVQAASGLGVDMVVMGGHGRADVANLLKGHVTEQVIGQSPCAVLVITA